MNIKYLYKNITIDDEKRDYIEKRLDTLKKIIENITKTEVEVGMDKKGLVRVEVMIYTPRDMFRAEETTANLESSIDIVIEELRTQITRKKNKIWTKIMRGARSIRKKMSLDDDARF